MERGAQLHRVSPAPPRSSFWQLRHAIPLGTPSRHLPARSGAGGARMVRLHVISAACGRALGAAPPPTRPWGVPGTRGRGEARSCSRAPTLPLAAAAGARRRAMSLHRPRALLLDVNGTLFPASSAAPVFEELGLDPQGVEVGRWRRVVGICAHRQRPPRPPAAVVCARAARRLCRPAVGCLSPLSRLGGAPPGPPARGGGQPPGVSGGGGAAACALLLLNTSPPHPLPPGCCPRTRRSA